MSCWRARSSMLGALRFEKMHRALRSFWCSVAGAARCRPTRDAPGSARSARRSRPGSSTKVSLATWALPFPQSGRLPGASRTRSSAGSTRSPGTPAHRSTGSPETTM